MQKRSNHTGCGLCCRLYFSSNIQCSIQAESLVFCIQCDRLGDLSLFKARGDNFSPNWPYFGDFLGKILKIFHFSCENCFGNFWTIFSRQSTTFRQLFQSVCLLYKLAILLNRPQVASMTAAFCYSRAALFLHIWSKFSIFLWADVWPDRKLILHMWMWMLAAAVLDGLNKTPRASSFSSRRCSKTAPVHFIISSVPVSV